MDKTKTEPSTIDAEKILAGPGCCKCTARIAELEQAVADAAAMASSAMAAADAAQAAAHGADHKAQVALGQPLTGR